MKHLRTLFVLLLGLTVTGAMIPVATAQDGQWQPMEPQGQWSSAWHSGFHDGIDAARHDIHDNRPPDPRRHDNFRHPDLPRGQREDFRDGFRRGYRMVYDHDWHGHPGR